MSLESTDYISGLTDTPNGTEPVSEGDDHLRLIKHVLRTTFNGGKSPPNQGLAGPVFCTHNELNMVLRARSNIQDQIDALAGKLSAPTNTVLIFYQAAPPAGWALDPTALSGLLHCVTNVAGQSPPQNGGFSYLPADGVAGDTVQHFPTRNDGYHLHGGKQDNTHGITENHTLSAAEMPSHIHYVANQDDAGSGGPAPGANNVMALQRSGTASTAYVLGATATLAIGGKSSATGGNAGHNHLIDGGGNDWQPRYFNVIKCKKLPPP
jgi:hypothetical protein